MAATAAIPAGMLGLRALAPAHAAETWYGESMGSPAALTLWHPDPGFARRTIARVVAEAGRLETVFSLFREDSELSRLNRAGALHLASADLVQVLEMARAMADLSAGAFDPTVQPLWQLHEAHFRLHPDSSDGPDRRAVDEARAMVGYARLDIGQRHIAFSAPTSVTLNGIAQGYIADRVTDLLRNEGFEHAMVEFGETRALGAAVDGEPFEVALRNPRNPAAVDRSVRIADQSLSVSGGYGFTFGRSAASHIFDPATGQNPGTLLDVAVITSRAVIADGLSTAIYVAGEAAAGDLLAAYPGSRALITRADGSRATL